MLVTKKKVKCWNCRRKHDLASSLFKDVTPKNGDVSLCIRCGEWGIFDSNNPNGLRRPTEDEFMEIGESTECRRVREAWVKIKRQHK